MSNGFPSIARTTAPNPDRLRKAVANARATVTPEQFAGRGRRAGARIEKGDIHFALGEGAVQRGEISDHER